MQLNYDFRMARASEGFRTDAGRPHDVDSWHNPINAQTNTATFGGTTTNGFYTLTFGQVGANDVVSSIERVGGSPATDTDLAVAHRDNINTTRAFQNLVTASNVGAVLTLAFRHTGIIYTVVSSAPAPGTLVVAQTVAPGGSFQRIGMMVAKAVVAGQDRRIAAITTGTTAADIVGLAEGAHHMINGVDFGLPYDAWPPGNEVPLGKSGRWEMRVLEAVTPASVVHMWNDETDPTGHPGQLAGSTMGGGAISLASLPIQFLTSAAEGELVTVQVGFGA